MTQLLKDLYVATSLFQSNIYKNKRGELNDLRAEYGVLARTLEILQARDESLKMALSAVEAEKGVSGYRDTRQGQFKLTRQYEMLENSYIRV